MSDEKLPPEIPADDAAELDMENPGVLAERKQGSNNYFRAMMDRNFLDYASYVIGSRAIPDVDDGLKPVQRRIMWTLREIYDNGRPTKTANVVGNTMHYHPHGDASIGDALVVLANKGGCVERVEKGRGGKEERHYVDVPYFIHKEGNFGNILTGSPAAAARYTECALTRLAYETMFNNDITEFVPNYDGRKQEPVILPAKVPSLLMLGSDGIAVGMSTMVLPHNFNELLDAEIAELKGEEFKLYPDFQQGGLMDIREYDDGNGRIILRAKIDIEGRELVIREIPATCTSASLIASIEKAAEKNKIRISSVEDFTRDRVEIRVTPTRGYDPERTLQGLYMYTDCSVSISPKMIVICDRRPVQMTVTDVLKRNVRKLLQYHKQEFELELTRQNELRHAKTLAQLFFENRIYKRIEECRTQEDEYREVLEGLAPFRDQLLRDVSKEDVDKLLALPVRRIARFDIEKNQQELRDIASRIKEIKHHLAHLTEYTIAYLEELKKTYGADFPRHTEIEQIEQIDRKKAALNNIKIGWDRKAGYIGTSIKSDDLITCNEFDKLLMVAKDGLYKVCNLPAEKLFVGKFYEIRRYDSKQEFGVIYRDSKSGKVYGKRSVIDKYITDKEYHLIPADCKILLLTPQPAGMYDMQFGAKKHEELNMYSLPQRSARARGILIAGKSLTKIIRLRDLTEEEILACSASPEEPENDVSEQENTVQENTPSPEVPEAVEVTGSVPAVEPAAEVSLPVAVEADPVEEPGSAPEMEEKTESGSAEDEDDFVLNGEVSAKVRRRPAKTPAKKTVVQEESAPAVSEKPVSKDEDDGLGIVQPEFGF